MSAEEIRKIFIEFFKKKSHQIVDSASLVPADPTALFTSAGMQQFAPYLSGKTTSPYKRACSVQKCFRTSDIDYHLEKNRFWITIFKGLSDREAGEDNIPCDDETEEIWLNNGIAQEKIKKFGAKDNFWGPVGSFGPCGPCSEIYYDRGAEFKKAECTLKGCGPNCGCGRFVEIWNLVFMGYYKDEKGNFSKMKNQNIDTGAGLERLTCVLQNKESDYQTELFQPLMQEIKNLSPNKDFLEDKHSRIIADHQAKKIGVMCLGVLLEEAQDMAVY